ncbi:E3 ubiquitin-protein ligase Mdm2 [Papilio xuthus]|uniref:E3 ubiquitin-protein ligase Mdm2 n=1 Tax=Papilio xuthus TaxID=66420 RepID=A0A194QJM5_PAPXU|nr:E3 ubiquitin-protein ligase Mdm2 [Papilio xuthus]
MKRTSDVDRRQKNYDIVRDTSDTEWASSEEERDVEYEPVTEPEDDAPLSWQSSSGSDNEIITTKVIEVSMRDDGDLVFADSEQTESNGSDSEIDLHDYWYCAQCLARNNNPLYRYCEKCFKTSPQLELLPQSIDLQIGPITSGNGLLQEISPDYDKGSYPVMIGLNIVMSANGWRKNNSKFVKVRKNFFPPRPKRKHKRNSLERDNTRIDPDINTKDEDIVVSRIDSDNMARLSQDSGVESLGIISASSQELGPSEGVGLSADNEVKSETSLSQNVILNRRKRRAESADRRDKRMKVDYSDSESDSDSETKVKPLVKMVSDPSLSIQEIDSVKLSKKAIINSIKENLDGDDNMCIICFSKPKSGVFVHGRIAHICCCYNCAVKVWAKAKRCPVCNCKVSNVLKAVVM